MVKFFEPEAAEIGLRSTWNVENLVENVENPLSCQVFPCGELSPEQKFMLTSKAKPELPRPIFLDLAV